MPTNTSRQAYLDWLRILAILGVLFFHSAMPYVAEWDWHIKNQEQSHLLLEFNYFLHQFRMPLLFFISGAVTWVMLQKRTTGQFIGLRFRRLLIPLIVGMLTLVPIQVYMERVNEGYRGNFFTFYPSVFTTGAYPKGNFSWHHLWFIAYLFLYDVVFASLFKTVIRKNYLKRLSWLSGGRHIYLTVLPSLILFSALILRFPESNDLVHDGCMLFYWLFFLLAGFLCMQAEGLVESLRRNRRFSFTLATLSIVTINYLRWNKLEPFDIYPDARHEAITYVYLALHAFNAWMWIFTCVGYGKQYLNKPLPMLNYANRAVYPFYILHQTVIVVLTYYVVKTTDTIWMKYLFTVILTFVISMAIYHLFIRPFGVMRFLFGAKEEKKDYKAAAAPVGATVFTDVAVATPV